MKKRILCLLLIMALCVSLVPAAYAADASLKNFKQVNQYTSGMFNDVASSAWYASGVQKAYELDLMKGSSDNKFVPAGNITIAEVITLASRLHNIYYTGSGDFTQGTPWYQVYVDYAVENGIITSGQYPTVTAAATRAQFVTILSKALPSSELSAINNIKDNAIPDVPSTASYASSVYLFYNAGILTGSDELGTFNPDSNIARNEVAAIVTRMADTSLRKKVSIVIAATGITLNKTSLTVAVGATGKLSATVSPANATDQTVTWTSARPDIVTVSSAGVVTGVSAGSTVILAELSNGKTATCYVTVPSVTVTGVSLNKTSVSLSTNQTCTLSATVTPANATSKSVTWSSSNTSVATVSSDGVVTARDEGTATIKATAGKYSASCTVTVSNISITMETSLPFTCSYYSSNGSKIYSTCIVTDYSYEATYYKYQDNYTAYVYLTGEKTYDYKGSSQSSKCYIGWKLYDSDGYVVDSGTAYSDSVAMGEKFRNTKIYLFDLAAGSYRLVLSNVN